MTKFYLYGLAGADNKYSIIRFEDTYVNESKPWDKVEAIFRDKAEELYNSHPAIKKVYAIKATPEVKEYALWTRKRNCIDTNVEFKIYLEDEGKPINLN